VAEDQVVEVVALVNYKSVKLWHQVMVHLLVQWEALEKVKVHLHLFHNQAYLKVNNKLDIT
jgi:hypothetical protein